MNTKLKYLITITLSIALGLTAGIYYERLNAEPPVDTIEKDTVEAETTYDLESFNNITTAIYDNFEFEGYTQIFKNATNTVVVPDIVAGRQDLENGLYDRSQQFMYKNPANGAIITVNISAKEPSDNDPSWNHSIGYDPGLQNDPEGFHKDSYDPIFSDSEVYLYSFDTHNVKVSVIGISENPHDKKVFTLSELARFVDQLVQFLNDNPFSKKTKE